MAEEWAEAAARTIRASGNAVQNLSVIISANAEGMRKLEAALEKAEIQLLCVELYEYLTDHGWPKSWALRFTRRWPERWVRGLSGKLIALD